MGSSALRQEGQPFIPLYWPLAAPGKGMTSGKVALFIYGQLQERNPAEIPIFQTAGGLTPQYWSGIWAAHPSIHCRYLTTTCVVDISPTLSLVCWLVISYSLLILLSFIVKLVFFIMVSVSSYPSLRLFKHLYIPLAFSFLFPFTSLINPSGTYFDLRYKICIFLNDKDQFSQHHLFKNASFPRGLEMTSLVQLTTYISLQF